MPEVLAKAIDDAMPRDLSMDSSWKERFAERFWDRLHQVRLRLRSDGTVKAGEATQTAPRVDLPGSEKPETTGRPHLPRLRKPRDRTPDVVVTDLAGSQGGRPTSMESSIPSWLPVAASEMDKAFTLASWDPDAANLDGSRGCVYINKEHPAIVALIEEMARAYNVTSADRASWGQIEGAVWETLGQSLVAKVVHAQAILRRDVEITTLRREYLSDIALTTAGLGMIWEQQALQPKIGGLLGRKKVS
jgi:hypothetical protein